jgi:hypothetical protein
MYTNMMISVLYDSLDLSAPIFSSLLLLQLMLLRILLYNIISDDFLHTPRASKVAFK